MTHVPARLLQSAVEVLQLTPPAALDELRRREREQLLIELRMSGRFSKKACAYLGTLLDAISAERDHIADAGKKVGEPLTRCAADIDGDCDHAGCPQLRDGEPGKTGRHCPLDTGTRDGEGGAA